MNLLILLILGYCSTAHTAVEGSPFFPESYKSATITMKQGRVLAGVKARIDMVTGETAVYASNMETLLAGVMVKQVVFADTTDGVVTQLTLRNGYPAVDRLTGTQFYLVQAEGKSSFLQAITKKVTERKNEFTGQTEKDYQTIEDYYLLVNGVMKKWKKDREFFLAEFADKRQEIETYIQQNKTSFRNPESVAQLVRYYNTL